MNVIRRIFNEMCSLFYRNNCILKNLKMRTKKDQVNIHWWFHNKGNIGDNLSPYIVERMLNEKGINIDKKVKQTKHLFAIGSIISFGYQNSTIWGSGLICGKKKHWSFWKFFRKLDIRAVRGPKTRETLLELGYKCPEIYGDPAILLPRFIHMDNNEKKYDYVIIKHLSDNRKINIDEGKNYIELDVRTDDFLEFVRKISLGKKVISSSLHGIILAESYGVPAIMLNYEGIDHFKFRDWYESTKRTSFPIANSIEEAINMQACELPDLQLMQNDLINSFPYDLYE